MTAEPFTLWSSITFEPVPRLLGISPHGLFSSLGFIAGLQLFLSETRRRGGLPESEVLRAFTYAIVGGLLGARLAFVLAHPDQHFGGGLTVTESLRRIVDLRRGGFSLFGALLGGALPAAYVGVRNRAHLPRCFDVAAPCIALGIAIGRIGDVLIWDHLGTPAHGWAGVAGFLVRPGYQLAPGYLISPAVPLPAGETCAEAARATLFYAGCVYHQPALYDLVGAAALLVLLLALRRQARVYAGVPILVWAAWYGTQRALIDGTRAVDRRLVLGLTGTRLAGIAMALAATAALVLVARRGRGLDEPAGAPPSHRAPLVRGSTADRHPG